MNKNNRHIIAQNTLQIIEEGYFTNENNDRVEVANLIENNVTKTFTVSPDGWEQLLSQPIQRFENATEIVVKNGSTIDAILKEKSGKIGVLNFASAKNPGGGFLGGASAQEESLARSSSLYASLTKDKTMYDFNKSQRTFLYSDYLIYSPETVFWFNDFGKPLVAPVIVDMVTSPAPNKGAMQQHNRTSEIEQIPNVFRQRIEQVLHIANQQGIETLILGAWGCGVFRNEPTMVAQLFMEALKEKYANAFKKVLFAIYDTSEKQLVYRAFSEVVG